MSKRLFEFPNPVNETSARIVASGVVAQGIVFLAVRQWWVRRSLLPYAPHFSKIIADGRMRSATLHEIPG